jgi:hypothetical protein
MQKTKASKGDEKMIDSGGTNIPSSLSSSCSSSGCITTSSSPFPLSSSSHKILTPLPSENNVPTTASSSNNNLEKDPLKNLDLYEKQLQTITSCACGHDKCAWAFHNRVSAGGTTPKKQTATFQSCASLNSGQIIKCENPIGSMCIQQHGVHRCITCALLEDDDGKEEESIISNPSSSFVAAEFHMATKGDDDKVEESKHIIQALVEADDAKLL